MKSDRYQKVRTLFHAACDLSEPERSRFLDDACGSDTPLRKEVMALLATDREVTDVFAEANIGIGHQLATSQDDVADAEASDSCIHGRFLPGSRIADRYRIVSLLGRGGMGEVYRADDLKLGHPVALKFLPHEFSQDPRRLEYFLSEVRLSRQVAHKNVCRVYDIGEVDNSYFLSMEYIDGEDLRRLLRRIGKLPRDKGIDIAHQLCRGLAAAHEKGVLHRDLKPANVMIDGRGQVRITDFGLARLATDTAAPREVVGTLDYMAPEQLTRGESTPQSDIYSLGLILHEVFTGKGAHEATSTNESISEQHLRPNTLMSSITDDIDPVVERAIKACIKTKSQERPPNALAVAAAMPGGDSLEAALAAGETPSPELVAGAADGQGLNTAMACMSFAAILMGMFCIIMLSVRSQRLIDFQAENLIRTSHARDLIERFGYGQSIADSTWGLAWDQHYFEFMQDNEPLRRQWTHITGTPPTAANFWYRVHSDDLVPQRGRGPFMSVLVTPDDPLPNQPGMIFIRLDASGNLLEFLCAPNGENQLASTENPSDSANWQSSFMNAAGIDDDRLKAEFAPLEDTKHRRPPPVFADSWKSWQSTSGSIILEAAAFQGRLVYFRIANTQMEQSHQRPRALGIVFTVALLIVIVTAVVLARNNWRSGRADLLGATRLFVFILVASVLHWLLQAHHVSGMGELAMILVTLARALLRAAIICAAYLALEPSVRRMWPQSLIGWNRLLRGRIRDKTVGRDVLVGVAAGVMAQLIGSAGLIVGSSRQIVLLAEPVLDIGSGPFDLSPLTGPHDAMGQMCIALTIGLVAGLVMPLFLVVLRSVLRETWLASIALVLFFSVPILVEGDVHGAVTVVLWTSLMLIVFLRIGVLAVAVGWFSWRLLGWPVALEFTSPHVDIGLLAFVLVAGLGLFGCWVSIGSSLSTQTALRRKLSPT